jgi:hypothetical protein
LIFFNDIAEVIFVFSRVKNGKMRACRGGFYCGSAMQNEQQARRVTRTQMEKEKKERFLFVPLYL